MCSSLIFALKSISLWFSLSSKQNAKSPLSESSTAQYTTLKEITTTDLNRTDKANWFRLMPFALHLIQKEVCLWLTALIQLTQLHCHALPMKIHCFWSPECIFLNYPIFSASLKLASVIIWSTLEKQSHPVLAATLSLKQVRSPCFIVPEHLENLKIQRHNPKIAWHLN